VSEAAMTIRQQALGLLPLAQTLAGRQSSA
jgi:hypothetical protein